MANWKKMAEAFGRAMADPSSSRAKGVAASDILRTLKVLGK